MISERFARYIGDGFICDGAVIAIAHAAKPTNERNLKDSTRISDGIGYIDSIIEGLTGEPANIKDKQTYLRRLNTVIEVFADQEPSLNPPENSLLDRLLSYRSCLFDILNGQGLDLDQTRLFFSKLGGRYSEKASAYCMPSNSSVFS